MTYQERIIEAVKVAENYQQQYDAVESIVDEMLKEESWAIDTTRTWKSYGTWSISVWVNTAHFGGALAEEIKKVRVITHNEDSVFAPEDLREQIMERVQEWAYLEAEKLQIWQGRKQM